MLEILYTLAITVEAMSGAIAAENKQMDPFGVLVIACSTAFGGGTARDVLLGNYPLVWIARPEFILIASFAALIALAIRPWIRHLSEAFLVLDAIGLITFSIIGALKTLQLGHSFLTASMMAVFTGAFGGVIRDILCNQIPLVFRKELYGSIAFASAWLYIGLCLTQLPHSLCITLTLLAGFTLRLLAIFMNLQLPGFHARNSKNLE